MTVKIDLKEIERRANYAAFQDGLIEIFMGLFLVFFGGAMATKATIVPFIVFAIFFANPILKRIKERHIYPRVGYVKLPQEEDTDTKGIGIAAVNDCYRKFMKNAIDPGRLFIGKMYSDGFTGYEFSPF